MTDEKKTDDDQKKPAQTVITVEEWDARLLAEHLCNVDHSEDFPEPRQGAEAPKVTVLNPFKTRFASGPVLDADELDKS